MHSTQLLNAARVHDGEVPPNWLRGDTVFQKASVLAAVAWSAVKPPADPELIACDLTFRENCTGIAESIMAGNQPDPTPFALKVLELWKQTDDYISQHPNKSTAMEVSHNA